MQPWVGAQRQPKESAPPQDRSANVQGLRSATPTPSCPDARARPSKGCPGKTTLNAASDLRRPHASRNNGGKVAQRGCNEAVAMPSGVIRRCALPRTGAQLPIAAQPFRPDGNPFRVVCLKTPIPRVAACAATLGSTVSRCQRERVGSVAARSNAAFQIVTSADRHDARPDADEPRAAPRAGVVPGVLGTRQESPRSSLSLVRPGRSIATVPARSPAEAMGK